MLSLVDGGEVLRLVVPLALVALAFFAGRDMRQSGAPMLAGISTCLLVLFLPFIGVPLWLIARTRLHRAAA